MVVFSDNNFFKLGVKVVADSLDENLLRELIVLDTGSDSGYILNVDFIRHFMFCDPLTVFAQCRHFLLFSQSDPGLWKREFAKKHNIEKAINSRICLAVNEKMS